MSLRDKKRAQIRADILTVCEKLFRTRGFDATGIDDIIARAKISRQTFFNYFSGKDAVLTELGLAWLQRQAALPAAPAKPGPVLAAARRAVLAQARAIEADKDFMRLVITHSGLFAPRSDDRHADHGRAIFEAVAAVIRAGQQAGEISKGYDPLQVAEAYVSTMLMTVRLWLTGYWGTKDNLERRMSAAIDILENGLRAPKRKT